MTHRPWLLLSAALTVTLPGVLAILAVLGHDHAVGESAALPASSFADSARPGLVPGASAKMKAPGRHATAALARRPGAPVTVDGTLTGAGRVLGMRLLVRAARASQATSYSGTELTSQAAVGGEVTTISQVWHSSGGPTLTRTSGPDAAVLRSPAGIFGLTRALVALLGSHYIAMYRGTGDTAGRPASLVEVYRLDGSLAARFWLDRRTLLPLRRELFDSSEQPTGEDTFVQVRLGALTGAPASFRGAATAVAGAGPSWVTAASPGVTLASLADDGWRLPAVLPNGLALYTAASTGTGTAEVIDLEYSDGLIVVSLFVQRGTLAATMAGWKPAILGRHVVYVSGGSVAWSWHGLICTMIADAPPRTVAAAVAALPRSAPAGVIDRFGRGLDRLAHLVNPFR